MDKMENREYKAKVFGKLAEVEVFVSEIPSPEIAQAVRGKLDDLMRKLSNREKTIDKNRRAIKAGN